MATNENNPAVEKQARIVQGIVVSDKMDKTRTVLVERQTKHPLYKKFIRRSSKYHIHDESNTSAMGDTVLITPCRPMSKTKSWQLKEVVKKSEL